MHKIRKSVYFAFVLKMKSKNTIIFYSKDDSLLSLDLGPFISVHLSIRRTKWLYMSAYIARQELTVAQTEQLSKDLIKIISSNDGEIKNQEYWD